jgi:hypothetical protein
MRHHVDLAEAGRWEYATIESGRMDFGINVPHWDLILNQSCALGCAKSFFNSVGHER